MTVLLFDEAREIAMNSIPDRRIKTLSLTEAEEHVCAEAVLAAVSLPPFARAMMDGYAVCHDDLQASGELLSVTDTVYAGDPESRQLPQGAAMRIMTGAAMPRNTDTVIRKEWCEETGSHIRILRDVKRGESVQPEGEDARRGDVILRKGELLSPLRIAALQGFGVATVRVFQRPKAAILCTGSELVTRPSTPLRAGEIYSVNHLLLQGLATRDGADVVAISHVPDNLRMIQQTVLDLSPRVDVILITGGVSVGAADFVPDALLELGADLRCRRVYLRPGSPFVTAALPGTAIYAMSGNPGACFVQYESFVRPSIRRLAGRYDPGFATQAKLAHDVSLKSIKHTRVQRGILTSDADGQLWMDLRIPQSSGVLSSFVESTALVRLDEDRYKKGKLVSVCTHS